MSENEEYWRNSKLDYFDAALKAIDDEIELKRLVNLMNNIQIKAVFKEFEDPYSSFNWHRGHTKYTDYYWTRWKRAVKNAKLTISQ